MGRVLTRYGFTLAVCIALTWPTAASGQGRTGTQSEAQRAVEEADALVKLKNFKDADELYKRAIAMDPSFVKAYERYSMSLFAQKKYQQGADVAFNGLNQLPGNDSLKAMLGMHLFKMRKIKEAYEALKNTVNTHPSRFEIQAPTAQCCYLVEDFECTVAALQNYLTSRPTSLAKGDYKFQVLQATAHLKLKQYNRSKKLLEKVLKAKPDYRPARSKMAEVLLAKGDCSRAVAAYERLYREKKSSELSLRLGQSYLCVRRYRSALRMADAHLREDKDSIEGMLLRGDAYFNLRSYTRSMLDYQRANVMTRGQPEVKLRIAKVSFRRKKYMATLAQLEDELKKPSPDENTLILALRAAIRAKRIRVAMSSAAKLLEKKQKNADIFYYAGMANNSAGQFEGAIPMFEKSLDLDKNHHGARREVIRALSHLGRLALKQKNQEDALRYLKKAYRYDPRSIVLNRNLAVVYLRLDKNKSALKHINVILKKIPRDYMGNRLAGRAYLQMDKKKTALEHYNRAMEVVMRHGGIALARIYAVTGVLQVQVGILDVGLLQLKEALQQAQRDGSVPALVLDIKRNYAQALVMKANDAMSKGENKDAWIRLQQAEAMSSDLPADERAVVQLNVALAALSTNKIEEGMKTIKKLRRQLGKLLVPPYDKVGFRLLNAYAQYLTPNPKDKLKAAAQFAKMASKLPSPHREKIKELARSAYEQAADRQFRSGQVKQAVKSMASARKLAKGTTPAQRHNMAVLQYFSGKKSAALSALEGIKSRIPLALCNIAVHHDNTGDGRKSYDLFKQCQKRGVPYPGLKGIVESKAWIFEGGQ